MKLLYRLYIPFLLLLVFACKSYKEQFFQPTRLEMTVIDSTNNALKGAIIRVFTNETLYIAAKQQGSNTGDIEVGITNKDGKYTLSGLSSDSIYYFLIIYRDRGVFQDLNNFDDEYKIPSTFIPGSFNTFTIVLKPAKNPISFFSKQVLPNLYPISIYLIGDSTRIGTINKPVVNNPNKPFLNDGSFTYKISSGKTKWYAKSATGCFWQGTIDLTGTESFIPVEISDCEAGAVSFWTDSINRRHLPIKIVLNSMTQKDTLNLLTQTRELAPDSCYSTNTLSAGRTAGYYTYFAKSSDGACLWTGNFTVSKGSCNIIKLTPCK